MEKQERRQFDEYAIVELFGHQRIAGRVTEAVIGGCSFVRVDTPEGLKAPSFTKLFGQGAIYAITIVDEQTARMAAAACNPEPMSEWSVKQYLNQITDGRPHQEGDTE